MTKQKDFWNSHNIDLYDHELFTVIKHMIMSLRVYEKPDTNTLAWNTGFGLNGVETILNKLNKLGVIKIIEEDKFCVREFDFKLDYLIDLMKTDQLNGIKEILTRDKIPHKEIQEFIKTHNNFLDSHFFKDYFYSEMMDCAEKYRHLNELSLIPFDLLIDTVKLDPLLVIKKSEYKIFTKMSDLIKKHAKWSTQKRLQSRFKHYFYRSKKETIILDFLTKKCRECDMIPENYLVAAMKKKNLTKKEILKTINSLENQGEIFKPRHKFYRTTTKK
jgi:hypothetical protein